MRHVFPPSFDITFYPSIQYLNIVNVIGDMIFDHEFILMVDHFLMSVSLKRRCHSTMFQSCISTHGTCVFSRTKQ